MQLFANRFVITDERQTIDLASGREVRLIVTSAGGDSDERRWAVRCDTLQKLRHRSIAPLVDYGPVADGRRFEAWECGAVWTGAADAARQVSDSALNFLDACDLSRGSVTAASVCRGAARPLLQPDATTGYPATRPTPSRAWTMADCGLELAPRAGLAAIAELFEPAISPRARAIAVWGPRGAGLSTAISELARAARLHGMVPVASPSLGAAIAPLLEGRTLLIIDDAAAVGWRSLVAAVLGAARPHVLLMAAGHEIDGVDCVPLERLPVDALVGAVRPADVPAALEDRVRRAAERADGWPGRFAQLLWGGSAAIERRGRSGTGSCAAEVPAVYGLDPESPSVRTSADSPRWPVPGELSALRRRAQSGAALVGRGRHAPGERALRQAAASLARRHDWAHAAQAALTLGRSMAARGRPKDAQAILADAREYATRGGHQDALVDAAICAGHVWIDLARLDEAETTLDVAVSAARAIRDTGRQAEAAVGMARCLFWRGRFPDADQAINVVEPLELPAPLSIRLAIAASRNAVGARNPGLAVSLSAAAVERAIGLEDPSLLARAGCAAAFAHLAVNDGDALERDVILSVAAARAARDPLRALRARLLFAEAARRKGRRSVAAALVERLRRLAGAALPAVVKARRDLLADLIVDQADTAGTVIRHVRSSGLPALALFGPSPARPEGWTGDVFVDDAVAILHACQNADDELQVLGDVCRRVRRQLGAASVAVASAGVPRPWTVASDGARVDLSIAERALAANTAIPPHRVADRLEAAVPIRYGGEAIGAFVARWALGASLSLSGAVPLLTVTAVAAAPAVAGARAARLRPPPSGLADFVGAGPASLELRRAVERAAAAPFSVLIEGAIDPQPHRSGHARRRGLVRPRVRSRDRTAVAPRP